MWYRIRLESDLIGLKLDILNSLGTFTFMDCEDDNYFPSREDFNFKDKLTKLFVFICPLIE